MTKLNLKQITKIIDNTLFNPTFKEIKQNLIKQIEQEINKFYSLLFLDIDGVLNHRLFYEDKEQMFNLIELEKQGLISHEEFKIKFDTEQIDKTKIYLLNKLCKDYNIKVVISSTWRTGRTVEELNELFKNVGATFEIIDKTGTSNHGKRGLEIYDWLNSFTYSDDSEYYNGKYVILDDDSDMLLWQRNNFFHVDGFCGLTPNICYKIGRFLERK